MATASKDEDIDKVILQLFTSLKELSELRRSYDTCVSEGYFNLTKTRHNMLGSLSGSTVSQVQYPNEMTAQTIIECNTDDGFRLSVDQPKAVSSDSSSQLRQRKKGEHKESANNKDRVESVTMDTVIDPIKWFSALPPTTLRNSQKQFKQGIDLLISIANVQNHIEELRRKFVTLSSKENNIEPETLCPRD